MLASHLSRKMASARTSYSIALSAGFLLLNLSVHCTYKWTGRISFSYLSLTLVFEDGLTHLTGAPSFLGVLLFALFTIVLLRGILMLFGTKMQGLGWALLVMLLLSALPIFEYSRIFI